MGESQSPRWLDSEPSTWYSLGSLMPALTPPLDMYKPLCTVVADTSQATKALKSHTTATGKTYYRQDFDVILLLGLTELKAQISWMEDVSGSSSFSDCPSQLLDHRFKGVEKRYSNSDPWMTR